MRVFKPNKEKIQRTDMLDINDDFYERVHGMGFHEYTLCGVACEEWDDAKELPRKIITCPKCMELIALCEEYSHTSKRALKGGEK